jgi:hypothetical protein
MGYEGLWVGRGILKMGSKNYKKIVENCRKYLGPLTCAKFCYFIISERSQLKQFLSSQSCLNKPKSASNLQAMG